MWDTLVSILPYTIGFIVSPLPVVALILVLVGRQGVRRATVFELFWLAASFVSILLIMMLIGDITPPEDGTKPPWQYSVTLLMGLVLLLVALLTRTRVYRKKHDKKIRKPGWLKAIDRFKTSEIALLSVALVVLNPTNLSMVLAASINLANLQIPVGEAVLPVAIFVLIGSLSVLVPYIVVVIAGERVHNALHAVRHWLMQHGDRLSFWAAFGFGTVFLYKGINGLL